MCHIGKGIPGIRKILADDASGWHLFTPDGHHSYTEAALSEVLNDPAWNGWTLTGVTGNGLYLQPEPTD